MGLGEVATRDWLRSELQDLVKELADHHVLQASENGHGREEPERP